MASTQTFRPPHFLNSSSCSSSKRIKSKSNKPMIIASKSVFTTFHQNPSNNNNNQKPPLLATIFNKLDNFISDFIDLPLTSSVDPNRVLSGNFAPVSELPPTACKAVEGSLPSCLDGGAYIRNGPNPSFIPKGPYHFMEGDGMLHMVKFSSHGKPPTFCCRHVSTYKLAVEREVGHPFIPSIFSSFNGGLLATVSRFLLTSARVLAGQFDPINLGMGPANTSLALISGHLYALCETDLPYAVDITAEGDLVTIGRRDFGAAGKFSRMTAHPKTDRVTGEVFGYIYDVVPPFLRLFRIDSDGGRRHKHVPIHSMKKLTMMHDFAVTENYAVVPELVVVVSPWRILRGRPPVGVDPAKVARVGVIPRYAEDEEEMVWVEAAGFNPLHCVNAWEEGGGDTVCMVAANPLAVGLLVDNIGCAQLTMEMAVVDLKARTVERRRLSPEFLESGVINPAYAAKRNRYIYASILEEHRLAGVVKLDLSMLSDEGCVDCTVASRRYGPSCHGSEASFVAREPNNPAAEEDDGYLVTYVHDDSTQESKLIVLDAKSSPNLEIIAAVKLPQRVPDGFHGLFLSETDLTSLRKVY